MGDNTKRRRMAACGWVPHRRLAEIAESVAQWLDVDVPAASRHSFARSVGEIGRSQTPFGPVMQTIRLPMTDGDFEWHIAHPFAYFYRLMSQSDGLCSLVGETMQRSPRGLGPSSRFSAASRLGVEP